jgi:hypothetical protein
VFRLVLERFSHHTLFKTDEIVQHLRKLQAEHQKKQIDDNVRFALDPSTHICSNSMGIPCIHKIL